MKLLRNGFDFYLFYLDRIYRIIRIFFACGEGPFGRRPHHPDDPVDPVQLNFKIRIHSAFSFQFYSFLLDQTGRFLARGSAEN
ncbi:hypothetical protein D1AOALGA4SA_905 [Olavius algarvensis Delta 1 endosymbiont]|nr:hypothetical protein D1AOALGA4SA_905 [Olavius algarvensis Delta 1 endosymbiont]